MRHGFDGFPETDPGCMPVWANGNEIPRVGRYLLGPERGRGGMGRVHLAWDPMLKRILAIKLLHNSDPVQTLRLVREAQAQARIEHPNICRIYEVSADGVQPFIAMQYIQGRPLGELRQLLSLEDIVHLVADVAAAIHAAHRAALIHRDLKPQNILVERGLDGTYKPFVLDFGLARDASMEDLTLSWCFAGTPAFTSPEQVKGDPPAPSMDIYSLGATLFAMCTGQPPLEAVTFAALLEQHATQPRLSIRRLVPTLPRDLDTIVAKCLESQPQRRYLSAFALEEDLRRWLAGCPIEARPLSLAARAWRRVLRHRALSAGIAAGVVFASTVAVVRWQMHRQALLQVELAQRFTGELRDLENLLRIQRLLEPHDMRPALENIKTRLWDLEALTQRMGSAAEGPGNFALGRGYLLLRDHERAAIHLQKAWATGFRSPEIHLALSQLFGQRYAQLLAEAGRQEPHPGSPDLLETWRKQALSHQQQAGDTGLDLPFLGDATQALLEGRLDDGIRHCRSSLRQAPWLYEALRLEAACHMRKSMDHQAKGEPDAQRRNLEAAGSALDKAMAIGRSDLMVHIERLRHLEAMEAFLRSQAQPVAETCAQAEQVFQRGRLLEPNSPMLWKAWLQVKAEAMDAALSEGQEVGPRVESLLAEVQEVFPVQMLPDDLRPAFGRLALLQAEAQWLRGGDPTPWIQQCWTWMPSTDLGRCHAGLLLARHALGQGHPPEGVLTAVEQHAKAISYTQPTDGRPLLVLAEVARLRALWDQQTGLEPVQHLLQARDHLRTAAPLLPHQAEPAWQAVRVQTQLGRYRLRRGQDISSEVQAAQAATLQAHHLQPRSYATSLAQAETLMLQAMDLRARHAPHQDLLQRTLEALDGAQIHNPHHPEAWELRAQVNLALAEGGAGGQAIQRTITACRQALARKADAVGCWRLLARAYLMQARLDEGAGHSASSARRMGQEAIQQALRHQPGDPEARVLSQALAPEGLPQGQRLD